MFDTYVRMSGRRSPDGPQDKSESEDPGTEARAHKLVEAFEALLPATATLVSHHFTRVLSGDRTRAHRARRQSRPSCVPSKARREPVPQGDSRSRGRRERIGDPRPGRREASNGPLHVR